MRLNHLSPSRQAGEAVNLPFVDWSLREYARTVSVIHQTACEPACSSQLAIAMRDIDRSFRARSRFIILGQQAIHACHRFVFEAASSNSIVDKPMIPTTAITSAFEPLVRASGRADLQLIEQHPILVLLHGLCLRHQAMILAEEARREAAKHPHQA